MNVIKTNHQYSILIAVDPTEPELRPTEDSLFWVRKWIKEKNAQVELVYISSELAPLAITEAEFSDYASNLNLGPELRTKILFEKSSSRRKLVEKLNQYSKNAGTDLIVVSSHGRSTIERLVMGSFSESLLAVSEVPLLFLNLKSDYPPRAEKVLFPTDLSKISKFALEIFLKELGPFQGELILYHAVLSPQFIFTEGAYGGSIFIPESYLAEQKLWVEKECDALLQIVKTRGLKGHVVIQNEVRSIPNAIQKFALEEKVDLIGLASISGGFDSAVLGSVGRGIFRLRRWPVWVCGPEVGGSHG